MKTKQILDLLRAYESRNVVFMEPDGSWPIVWERARDVFVWDADGKNIWTYRRHSVLPPQATLIGASSRPVKTDGAVAPRNGRRASACGHTRPSSARELSRLTFERWGNFRRGRAPRVRNIWSVLPSPLKSSATIATAFDGTCNSSWDTTNRAPVPVEDQHVALSRSEAEPADGQVDRSLAGSGEVARDEGFRSEIGFVQSNPRIEGE